MSINPGLVDAQAVVLVIWKTKGLVAVSWSLRLLSGVVGDEANAEESAALDDRLGMAGFRAGVGVLWYEPAPSLG